MNQIVLMGRLTRAPELRQTNSNVAVTSFTLAVDRGYAVGDGERKTDFIDCVAWRSTAEFICRYFSKGQMMAVIGQLQIRSWTDDEGNRRKAAEVVADNVYFTGDRRSENRQPENQDNRYFSQIPDSEFEEMMEGDGDLPF